MCNLKILYQLVYFSIIQRNLAKGHCYKYPFCSVVPAIVMLNLWLTKDLLQETDRAYFTETISDIKFLFPFTSFLLN